MDAGLRDNYMYQQAIRRRGNVPAEVSATPTLRDITMEYGRARARAGNRAAAASDRNRLEALQLAELARRSEVALNMRREQFDDARTAGLWASGIGLANLMGTGADAFIRSGNEKRARVRDREMLNLRRKALQREQEQSGRILGLYQDMMKRLKR